ncbi:MAG: thiamine phosphate synthase [Acidobacteriota bacterium]
MALESPLPSIYPITDRQLSGLSHAEQVRRLVVGGAPFIQLREKHLGSREFYDDALESIRYAHENNARILINDRVDLAIAAGADGVHLGQDDLPPVEARKLLGEKAIIGYSTHDLDQVREALDLPIDYIAFGPVFDTLTKAKADAVTGLAELREARRVAGSFPLVAIGGIDAARLHEVFATRADSAAVISAVVASPDAISERIAELLAIESA